jgi:hypothetical protein
VTPTDYFSDPVIYEVRDGDLEELEIRARKGGTIAGKVVLDGLTDPALLAKLSKFGVRASLTPSPRSGFTPVPAASAVTDVQFKADGSFRLGGLASGKVWFEADNVWPTETLTLLRIEVDGVPQPDGLDIAAGQQISNVRLVFAYGQTTVRGQVQLVGGTLPEGVRLSVIARRTVGQSGSEKYAPVDARGRFMLEGVVAGESELTLEAAPNNPKVRLPGLPRAVRQRIVVPQAGEIAVTITLDLTPR